MQIPVKLLITFMPHFVNKSACSTACKSLAKVSRKGLMRFRLPFICDECGGMLSPEDGLVIWNVNKIDWQVTLFVVHNTKACLGDELGNRETFSYSCTLQGFMASNGQREYFNLLVAEENWSAARVKEIGPKLKLRPELFQMSAEEVQSPNALIEAELSRRRALLKQSIADTVGRFFVDFRPDEYWMSEKELHQAMVEDLSGSGIRMEWI